MRVQDDVGPESVSHVRSAHRMFYTMPTKRNLDHFECDTYSPSYCRKSDESDEYTNFCITNNATDTSNLMRYINENIIGRNKVFRSPFGDRKTVYCDWTASGKSVYFIEDFINTEVLPTYGNTHTTTNVTSLQTTMFRHEAKDVIRNAVRASTDDAVIFVGSGCTGAVHKLIHNLHLEQPPIVIVGPFEHHSNILPWRHLASKVCRAKTDSSGTVSLKSLEAILRIECVTAQELGCKLIVCMAAASNVTGILVDVDAFSSLTHRYGGLAFWDYATAAPYVKVDMNPVVTGPDRDLVYKDAVYFSMHKFIGGPQTPGVLIAKRSLFSAGEIQPSGCGGGTVFFVRRDAHVYLKDVEEREEGGTPAIVESIRAGLVMQLKEAVTCEAIVEREEMLVQRIWSRIVDCRNLIVLGGKEAARLPIISVVIRHIYPTPEVPSSSTKSERRCLFLHHNFVSALLNDLFGIQSRGGCACAGPYAMDLLGIDEALAKLYEDTLVDCSWDSLRNTRLYDAPQREIIRPGFVRVSLPFFISDTEADFILDAIKFVATHGWAFLPLYRYNSCTGEWVHRQHDPSRDRKWLGNVHYTKGKMSWSSAKLKSTSPPPESYEACLKAAHEELCKTVRLIDLSDSSPVPDDTGCFDERFRELRWFLLPSEAAAQIRNEINQLSVSIPNSAPWHPGSLSLCFCPDLQNQTLQRMALEVESRKDCLDPTSESYCTPVSDKSLHVDVPLAIHRTVRPHSAIPIPFSRLKVTHVALNTINLVQRRGHCKRSASLNPSHILRHTNPINADNEVSMQTHSVVPFTKRKEYPEELVPSKNQNRCVPSKMTSSLSSDANNSCAILSQPALLLNGVAKPTVTLLCHSRKRGSVSTFSPQRNKMSSANNSWFQPPKSLYKPFAQVSFFKKTSFCPSYPFMT